MLQNFGLEMASLQRSLASFLRWLPACGDTTFIASYKSNNKRELAQSVQALQKLSYDLLGLIDDQQKTHLRQYDERIESNISDILETEFGVKDNNRLKFCEENSTTMENNLEIIRANKEGN